MADLSRALQFLLCSIGNLFLFLLRTISLSGTIYLQYDAGHYLIHIITGFIIRIIISATPTITDLILLILTFCLFLPLELVLLFYKHLFLLFYLAIYLNVSNKSSTIKKRSESRCANNIIVIIFVRPSPWAFYSLHYLALTLYLSAACLYASLCNHSGWYFNFRVYSVLSQVMYFLWRDVIREATFSWGSYKKSTTEAYVSALHFFIFSEVYVFF